MDWVSRIAIFVLLVIIAYHWAKLPRRLDQYIRSLAVEYKRWSDRDDLHEQVIRKERETSPTSLRRLTRMEMNREDEANAFRRLDEKTLDFIEKRNEKQLAELEELDKDRETLR